MKPRIIIVSMGVVSAFLIVLLLVRAESSHTEFAYYAEVSSPGMSPGLYSFAVPLEVMDKSRDDLADLRLSSGGGDEIPYALRIRKDVDDTTEVDARLFNQSQSGMVAEVSLDLGESPDEHNAVEIESSGENYRRRVEVEGSDTLSGWRSLKAGALIFDFSSQNKAVESKLVSYPRSRFRYLRVRVFADDVADKRAPVINGVKVLMTVRDNGELTTWHVITPYHELGRAERAPASIWLIDLGRRVPCDRLTLDVGNESFSRHFEIESIDDVQNPRFVSSGEITRRVGEKTKPVVLRFEQEVFARRLRLQITDYSNEPLAINSIEAAAPAREIVFELKQTQAAPLRLYFGSQNQDAPHYDFEKELRERLVSVPQACSISETLNNPDFVAPPIPITERTPWLIYVVLAASSLALAAILIKLARGVAGSTPPENKKAAI